VEITEVRIRLVAAKNDKLRAFCSITIDDAFVIRDLKIIEGVKGPFVAMPSRKVMERCRRCGEKNHHRAKFCNECGGKLAQTANGRGGKMHADIAHPINSACRELVQGRILDGYTEELERSRRPDYKPADIDDYEEIGVEDALAGLSGGLSGAGEAGADDLPPSRPGAERSSLPLPPRFGLEGAGGLRAEPPASPVPPRGAERLGELRARPLQGADAEPEDNFGAGLFS
jgi:stage V sporulation protein G